MLVRLSEDEIMREYVLSKIIRYNHRRRLQDESVAEHSFYVSLFCLKIMKSLDLSLEEQNQVLVLAALHDAAESKTSDIPHDVKKNYPEMEEILGQIENDYYHEVWKEYEDIILHRSELVHAIVKLADSYSVYQYCLNEKSLGNVSDDIQEIYFDCQKRIEMWINKINEEIEKENRK